MNPLALLRSQIWGMQPNAIDALSERLSVITAGGRLVPEGNANIGDRVRLCYNGGNPIIPVIANGVATIEIIGDLVARAPWWAKAYGDTIDPFDVADAFDTLASNPEVQQVVIEADCPGGTISGAQEAADAMTRLQAAGKTVEIRAAGLMCSAFYWMCCGADRIVATSTTWVGSLGVLYVLRDTTAAQAECGQRLEVISSAPGKGLGMDGSITPALRAAKQKQVADLVAAFRDHVAAARGLTTAQLDALFTGEMWLAPTAQESGLIDAVASPADTDAAATGTATPPAPAPIPVTDDQCGDGNPSATHTHVPATGGTASQKAAPMAVTIATLSALIGAHPAIAKEIAAEAAKADATDAGITAFAKDTQIAVLNKQLEDATAKATASDAAKAKAEADLAKLRNHAGAPIDPGSEGTGNGTEDTRRKIPLAKSAELTTQDLADIKAGKAVLADVPAT